MTNPAVSPRQPAPDPPLADVIPLPGVTLPDPAEDEPATPAGPTVLYTELGTPLYGGADLTADELAAARRRVEADCRPPWARWARRFW